MQEKSTSSAKVHAVLQRRTPSRIVYAPNYWQWFTHHRNHASLPGELRECVSQLDLLEHLEVDVFSRNLYCDATRYWFGGLSAEVWDGVEVIERRFQEGRDTVTERTFHTSQGTLTERLRYVFEQSTLVQEKHLLDDYEKQLDAFERLVQGRRWRFDAALYREWQERIGGRGVLNAGELFSPLKLLHLAAGADQAVYLLADYPERCAEWMALHEAAQLDLVRQMLAAGVPSMMAMDNLDSAFHPPAYLERCSASFYEHASRLCREHGSTFFIHACGGQRAILPLIALLGVDGLEGVAFPPLGNVELDEAMRLSGDRLIITGGISAFETERLASYDTVRSYLENLLRRMEPHRHRFMLTASCNTSIRSPWQTLVWLRDAWRELGLGDWYDYVKS
jgi:hypothetical protein